MCQKRMSGNSICYASKDNSTAMLLPCDNYCKDTSERLSSLARSAFVVIEPRLFDMIPRLLLCAVVVRLLDVDLAGLGSLSLGDNDGEDAVFQRGLDSVLIDALREAKAAMELANGALTNPVF